MITPVAPPPNWAQVPQATPAYAAPPAPQVKSAISPIALIVGAVALVAVLAGGYMMMNQSKGTPKPGGIIFGSASPVASAEETATLVPTPTHAGKTATPAPAKGAITYEPASFDCSSTTTQVKVTVYLPASLEAGDTVKGELDGANIGTATVGDHYAQQDDGRWFETTNSSAANICGSGISAGKHVVRLLDANDNELARGSFTNTAGAKPTPGGQVTIQPSSFSCSSTGQIKMSVWLPASMQGSDEVTIKLDGVTLTTSTISDGFEKQADGRWLSSGSSSTSSICNSVSVGDHTFVVYDSNDEVLASGSFTTKP